MSNSLSSSLGVSLTASDKQRFAAWNATHQAYPPDMSVPQLVAAHAAATPNAAAVVVDKEVITYGELDGRANQIGHFLRSHGVGPDTLVGLCLGRSAELIAAALGVLKSGGAYVPLDPAYPQERVAFMLNDARPTVLFTEQRFAKLLTAGKWLTVKLDIDEPQITRHSMAGTKSDVRGENLAYVIYTSGSTGRPKGVQIAHSSLLNLVFWHQRTFDVRPIDRASQLASPGFDAAVWELWPYLAAGASVHLPDGATRSEPEALCNWLVNQRITIAFVPTPLAERMIALDWPPETALRVLLTGADTLHSYPPASLPFTLVNNYGPTECTVVATSGPVSSNERPDTRPPIGRPIANTQIYILDEHMRQVPVRVPGELHIGGVGLARGYLNAPELTAARFIPNPFSSEPNARLYKTGDVAYYLPDGQIAFLGRTDEQIKIRGYRIEPNEIVTVLDQHPMVQESVVLAQEEKPGEKCLLAYIVPKLGTEPADKTLREFLSNQLPDYMVPSFFVRLKSLPLNASGKIDRAALPRPTEVNILRDETYKPPRSPIEQRLAALLASLLKLDTVGVNDNFFLLGGNSLLGAQIIARLRDALGIELRLVALFDHPTVSELSAEVERLLLAKINNMSEHEGRRLLWLDCPTAADTHDSDHTTTKR